MRGTVASGLAERFVGPLVPGVLVQFFAPAKDCPVLAGVLFGRAHEAQDTKAVRVVVDLEEGACPWAGAHEIGKAFRGFQRKGGMVSRGAEQGLQVRVVAALPRARVRGAEAEGTQGDLHSAGFQGAAVVSVQDDRRVHRGKVLRESRAREMGWGVLGVLLGSVTHKPSIS